MTISVTYLEQENANLKKENGYLKEQLEWFRRQLFGKSSEKIIHTHDENQILFKFLENLPQPQEPEKQIIPAHQRAKPKEPGQDKLAFPEDLPIERRILDLPEEEKKEGFVKIGEEVTQKLAHRKGSYFMIEYIRSKYASKNEEGIFIAPMPESLLDRCQADESLLADILVKKFSDHLPLYRQVEMLARDGINISRQLLSKWVLRCGMALKPLYDEMASQILSTGNIFIDETPINMLSPGKGKVHQAYMWVMVGGKDANPSNRIYHFKKDRRYIHADQLLKGFQGVLHSDKYGAYEALASKKQFIWCPCWAHIRRKFFEAETGDPPLRKWILRKIKYLFMLERIAWARSEEERLRIRQEKEIPIIDELIKVIQDRLMNGKTLIKSKFNEALGYFFSLIPYLKNYCKHAYARLDNNVAERAVRPLAIGRKNWLFVGSEDGGEAAAVILSLIQSCKAIGIDPREYLEDVMRRLMSHNSQKLFELLPNHWIKNRQ
jgi:transposase